MLDTFGEVFLYKMFMEKIFKKGYGAYFLSV